jgi:glycosyltransferase involved in cell wall biosynthesis
VAEERPLRVAVVGVSKNATCGVRDYATLLAQALAAEQVECSLHWLAREQESLRPAIAELRTWTRELARELAREELDAVLWHYSVFTWSVRGIPVLVHPLLRVARETGVPLVGVLHEYAYPWRRGGLRGKAWALSQRAELIEVVRACGAMVVTDVARARWLSTRRWLARRPTAVAPVFSNLPGAGDRRSTDPGDVIGLFGYSHEGVEMEVVLDALRLLEDRGIAAQLLLLGAPGRESATGARWLTAAGARRIARPPHFSGVLPAQELADALASCAVLLAVDRAGPTPRKTTLAASLASGRPVLALDGPQRWPELAREEAALVVGPRAQALADALARLLGDERSREELGERGREFARREMSVEHSAGVVAGLLRELVSQPVAWR